MRYQCSKYFEVVDPASVERVLEEHGADKLTPELSRLVDVRQVYVGQSCDDLPEGKLRHLVASGYVVDTGEPQVVDAAGWPESITPKAADALDGAGVTPADVASRTDEHLLEIPGVGPGTVKAHQAPFGEFVPDEDATGEGSDDEDLEDDGDAGGEEE